MFNMIKHTIKCFFKNPFITTKLIFLILKKKYFWSEKDRFFYYKCKKLIYPSLALWWVFWSIKEIFIEEYYHKLKWCNNILDLWWYFWESSIYFATNNSNVDVYEADPSIYKYLYDNVKSISKVKSYNKAVVANNNQNIYFDDLWEWFTMSWHITEKKTNKLVECVHIKNIINQKDYDWIKIDIEWSEHEIINWMNQNYDWWSFDIWYIEFHYINDIHLSMIQVLLDLLELLKQSNFKIEVFNAHNGEKISSDTDYLKNNILQKKLDIIFLSFEKVNA